MDKDRPAALGQSVVLGSDHGQALGEHGEATHGFFAYNSALWVPLVVAGPGVKPGRVEQNVCHVDIFPTVCDLLGLPKPAWLAETQKLWPSWKAEGDALRQAKAPEGLADVQVVDDFPTWGSRD